MLPDSCKAPQVTSMGHKAAHRDFAVDDNQFGGVEMPNINSIFGQIAEGTLSYSIALVLTNLPRFCEGD